MPTTARLVNELTGESIQLEYDDSDPLWCNYCIKTGSIDFGFAAPRVVQNNIPEANGTTDLTEFHADKTVTWNGWISPTIDDPFPAVTWDKIRGLCAPHRRPWMYAQENGWPQERRMTLRADSMTSPLDRAMGPVIVAGAVWKVPSGVMESADLNTTAILGGVASGGNCITSEGLCFTNAGWCFDGGDFGGDTIIFNAGTTVAYPFMTFVGPSVNPFVVNTRTQTGIHLTGTLVPGQQIVVDNLNKRVYEPALPNVINRLAMYNFNTSVWQTLEEGDNPFRYGDQNNTGSCTISWRDRWI
jgi:hypothetical protein